jgi:hypothetical protein
MIRMLNGNGVPKIFEPQFGMSKTSAHAARKVLKLLSYKVSTILKSKKLALQAVEESVTNKCLDLKRGFL